MSPIERRSGRSTTTAVLVALGGLVAGIGLMFVMVNMASKGGENVKLNIGSDFFDAGNAQARSESIQKDGPILFADVAGRDRDIILQHIGNDPTTEWYALAAAPSGKARDCTLVWNKDSQDFVDCDGQRFPANGDGLMTYPVTVENGRLSVDLNAEFRSDDADD
ncbi:MAG: hypothetical protein WC184_11175 [Acidimicrobiia bacterium]